MSQVKRKQGHKPSAKNQTLNKLAWKIINLSRSHRYKATAKC